MMNYFREGGFPMWVILFIAVGSVGIALFRGPKARPMVLLAGCIGTIISGVGGMALGMDMVSKGFAHHPDKVEALGIGLGELSNCGSFSAALAFLLGVAAIVAHRRAPEA